MFELTNTPRPYAWGSRFALAEFRGVPASGEPEAEFWLGDHPGSPAVRVSDGATLIEWEAADSTRKPLRFLLKVLAVAAPLSVQVHPSREQARDGFARENAAGIPLDSPERNYRDDNHKPEVILALDTFSALAGFRPSVERDRIVTFCVDAGLDGAVELAEALEGGLSNAAEGIVRHEPWTFRLSAALVGEITGTPDPLIEDAIDIARFLAAHYPGDPGVLFALLLNHIVLQPGEALFAAAGTVHAYLSGLGVELMAASDNVLRGGLTSKHIDGDEFLRVATIREDEPHLIEPNRSRAVTTFPLPIDDCELRTVDVDGPVEVHTSTPAVALVIGGTITVSTEDAMVLTRGRAVYLESGDELVRLDGSGTLVIAS